jgi:hypothetical protein
MGKFIRTTQKEHQFQAKHMILRWVVSHCVKSRYYGRLSDADDAIISEAANFAYVCETSS